MTIYAVMGAALLSPVLPWIAGHIKQQVGSLFVKGAYERG